MNGCVKRATLRDKIYINQNHDRSVNTMNENELKSLISEIRPASRAAMELAAKRQSELAKPPGSLGRLEELSVRIAGMTGNVKNEMEKRRIAVFVADNGVVDEGVAVTPKDVTLKQAVNMTRHVTGMSTLAEFFGDETRIIDVGIDSDEEFEGIINRKIRRGTGNIRSGAAMTREEAVAAIGVGAGAAKRAKTDGVQALGIGEMGIGNTTTSAAVLAALTGADPANVTGRGSGLTDAAFYNKVSVIREALSWNMPDPRDPVDIIAKVGGLDIAAMTGAFLGCAYERIPAVADGFISTVAALCAVRLCPETRDFVILSHASRELGYVIATRALELAPYLALDMRLGEGSGCPLAFQLMRAACAVMNNMATFEEARIDDGYLDEIRRQPDPGSNFGGI